MFFQVIRLITAGLEAWASYQQYRLINYARQTHKDIERDIDNLRREIIQYRAANRDRDADRLLEQQAILSGIRSSVARGLSVLAGRSIILSRSSGEVGEPEAPTGEGRNNSEPH